KSEEGLNKIEEILTSGDSDRVVLDELNIALHYKLFSVDRVIEILKNRKSNIEVVITGRYAPEKIIEIADLVTEMKEIKHYYKAGVEARTGIEK
ncbi:MAG: cob(I)yrinic acid a,c-diamide adenosyltransferase, partial [Clostridium sp.]|nr:cob(I)yrinic acid a,c-diamide adenosyltransferase [Clostridium sp.]